jgi:hypothetical protein
MQFEGRLYPSGSLSDIVLCERAEFGWYVQCTLDHARIQHKWPIAGPFWQIQIHPSEQSCRGCLCQRAVCVVERERINWGLADNRVTSRGTSQLSSPSIADDKAFVTPCSSQQVVLELSICATRNSVQRGIGAHDTLCAALRRQAREVCERCTGV